MVGEEGDDLHFSLAFGTAQGINLINLADHLNPAAAGDSWAFFLDDQKLKDWKKEKQEEKKEKKS